MFLKKGCQITAILFLLAPVAVLTRLGGFLPEFLKCQFFALTEESIPRAIIIAALFRFSQKCGPGRCSADPHLHCQVGILPDSCHDGVLP